MIHFVSGSGVNLGAKPTDRDFSGLKVGTICFVEPAFELHSALQEAFSDVF
jgi:hypothetical protein